MPLAFKATKNFIEDNLDRKLSYRFEYRNVLQDDFLTSGKKYP